MRGKKAAGAANRRADAATSRMEVVVAENKQLHAQLDAMRRDHAQELYDVTKDLPRRAGELAAADLADRDKVIDGLRDDLRTVNEVWAQVTYRQDRLIFNACRFLSMQEGRPPIHVLPGVLTWLTDQPTKRLTDPAEMITRLGVDPRGWTGRMLRSLDKTRERFLAHTYRDPTLAYPLDYVEEQPEQFEQQVHPDYQPRWYGRVKWDGLVLIDEDEERRAEMGDGRDAGPS